MSDSAVVFFLLIANARKHNFSLMMSGCFVVGGIVHVYVLSRPGAYRPCLKISRGLRTEVGRRQVHSTVVLQAYPSLPSTASSESRLTLALLSSAGPPSVMARIPRVLENDRCFVSDPKESTSDTLAVLLAKRPRVDKRWALHL